MTVTDFPVAYTRSRGFRLGQPRDFAIAPDGRRVMFLRAAARDDPTTCLWEWDVANGQERLVADPRVIAPQADEELSDAERALRQRTRQYSTGIVSFATDEPMRRAVFVLGGVPWVLDLSTGDTIALSTPPSAMEARLDPTGARVAYVVDGALRVVDVNGDNDHAIAEPEHDDVTYGLAEHVAAESMYRYQGYWWSPDGASLAVARVDTAQVQRWYLADPTNPATAPTPVAYPAAGTPNAEVSLWLYGLDGGEPTPVRWPGVEFEYLVSVRWSSQALHLVVQSRDQRTVRVLEADPATGTTSVLREEHDDAWVEVVHGVPALTKSGALLWISASEDTWRLCVDGQPVTAAGLQVSEVSDVDGDTVLFAASDDPTEQHLWTWSAADGVRRVTDAPGVYSGRRAGGTTVVNARSLEFAGQRTSVSSEHAEAAEIVSHAEVPALHIQPILHQFGERELRTAVLFPAGHVAGQRLPVLLDPYSGPHARTVLKTREVFATSQWFADQGFAVLVTDGRGTPGRGLAFEQAILGDKLAPVLEDQIDALRAAARQYPDLDLDRVAIRGSSYGGYLAAAAVLRRPDVFHAAVALASVTDPKMYDAHWMERYLGHPDEQPDNYARNSLIPDAPNLRRPLLLVHGLADDNVVVANTLRLSQALLAAGRDHRILPLTGATHMAPTDDSGPNLFLVERDFLLGALNPVVDDVRLGRSSW
jgi:dipeptidyl-peptidase-4